MGIGYSIGQPVKAPGDFDVDGELSVHDDTSIDGSLQCAGDLSINTNKFTVDAATGDTALRGDLSVEGVVTGPDDMLQVPSLTVNDELVVADPNFGVDSVGNTHVAGYLQVSGAITRRKASVVAVTSNTSVTAAQTGSTFIVTGGTGVIFTLPAAAEGLIFDFANMVNYVMEITTDLHPIHAHGIDDAESVAFSGTDKIGAACRAIGTTSGWVIANTSDLAMAVS